MTQIGWDCIIIPGAFLNSNFGAVQTTQTTALIQQVLTQANTNMNSGSGPQICGQGGGIGPGVANFNTGGWVGIQANLQSTMAGVTAANGNVSVCSK